MPINWILGHKSQHACACFMHEYTYLRHAYVYFMYMHIYLCPQTQILGFLLFCNFSLLLSYVYILCSLDITCLALGSIK